MSQLYETILDPQRRGAEFKYNFTLGNGWTASMFTGSLKFTLRSTLPESSVTTDVVGANGCVDQASVSGGEITFSDTTHGTILIPGSRTTAWPGRTLFWDLQGIVTVGNRVLDIDAGTISVVKDVTRGQ